MALIGRLRYSIQPVCIFDDLSDSLSHDVTRPFDVREFNFASFSSSSSKEGLKSSEKARPTTHNSSAFAPRTFCHETERTSQCRLTTPCA